MELTCGLVLQERSGAMGRSTTLCNENDDDDDDNMVAVVSCDAVLHFYISIVWVSGSVLTLVPVVLINTP